MCRVRDFRMLSPKRDQIPPLTAQRATWKKEENCKSQRGWKTPRKQGILDRAVLTYELRETVAAGTEPARV